MQVSFGDKVCDWVIGALRGFATLPFDLQIVPLASSETAANERLVVTCEVGSKMLEGPKPYECEIGFVFQTVNRSAEEAEDVFAKIESVLFSSLNNAAAVTLATSMAFTWIQAFPEEANTTVENSGNFRKYTRSLPLRAL